MTFEFVVVQHLQPGLSDDITAVDASLIWKGSFNALTRIVRKEDVGGRRMEQLTCIDILFFF